MHPHQGEMKNIKQDPGEKSRQDDPLSSMQDRTRQQYRK
jgi:hypothetical protein